MPDLTTEDDYFVSVRRTAATPRQPGRVLLVCGDGAALLSPAEASQLAVYLTSVADIVEKGEDRG